MARIVCDSLKTRTVAPDLVGVGLVVGVGVVVGVFVVGLGVGVLVVGAGVDVGLEVVSTKSPNTSGSDWSGYAHVTWLSMRRPSELNRPARGVSVSTMIVDMLLSSSALEFRPSCS